MTHCPESFRVQDYLDDELVPAERESFELHLAGCAACEAELAVYRRVFTELETLPMWDPSPDLADRVLAEVMPGHAARWSRALGWVYGGSVAASAAAIAAAVFLPGPREWTYGLVAEAMQSVVTSFLFVLKSINAAALRLVDIADLVGLALARLAPILRALRLPLTHPAFAFTLGAAALVCIAVFWWMRPREDRSIRGDHHVGLLGL